jgi:hypothetical protein
MNQVADEKEVGYLKIVFPIEDHERVRNVARNKRISMSAYIRIAVLEQVERDETKRRTQVKA